MNRVEKDKAKLTLFTYGFFLSITFLNLDMKCLEVVETYLVNIHNCLQKFVKHLEFSCFSKWKHTRVDIVGYSPPSAPADAHHPSSSPGLGFGWSSALCRHKWGWCTYAHTYVLCELRMHVRCTYGRPVAWPFDTSMYKLVGYV